MTRVAPIRRAASSAMIAITLVAASTTAARSDVAAPGCHDVRTPVTLNEVDPTVYSVYGLFCPGDEALPGAIALLVSGATEGGVAYWDFPSAAEDTPEMHEFRDRYSFVKYLTDAGYASFTLDRIGTANSDHPPAEIVTLPSNAYVVHQIVARLRAGAFGLAYTHVIGAGRSLGAAVMYEESILYGDLDGLMIQSFRQHRQLPFAEFPTTFEPALLEPRFASLPPGYITTRPGTRAGLFFYAPNADPNVIALEEQKKETITDAEIATFPESFPLTNLVTPPIISLVGEFDTLFCSAAGCPEASQEASNFPNVRCFESVVIPNAGHDMDLHYAAETNVFPLMKGWLDRTFGSGSVPC